MAEPETQCHQHNMIVAQQALLNSIEMLEKERRELKKELANCKLQLLETKAERDRLKEAKRCTQTECAREDLKQEDAKIGRYDSAGWKKAANFGPGGTKQCSFVIDCIEKFGRGRRDEYVPVFFSHSNFSNPFLCDVYLWKPTDQFPGCSTSSLACPQCSLGLTPCVWNTAGPTKIHTERGPALYLCHMYQCTAGHRIRSDDDRFLSQLPLRVQLSFPLLLTRESGITHILRDLLLEHMTYRSTAATFARHLRTVYGNIYLRKVSIALAITMEKKDLHANSAFPFIPEPPPASFDSFYEGPSDDFLRMIGHEHLSSVEKMHDDWMKCLDGRLLRFDHTFEVASKIFLQATPQRSSDAPYNAIFDVGSRFRSMRPRFEHGDY